MVVVDRADPAQLERIRALDTTEPVRLPLVKVVVDKTVALLLLLVTLPLGAAIALAVLLGGLVRAGDRGPVILTETRVSGGRLFRLPKFRIFTKAAIERELGELGLPPKTVENSPTNLTAVGRALKRLGVDEIPQLVSVLRGEMTLVGPRPKPPAEYEEELRRGIHRRAVMPAGLTGPAQLLKGTDRTIQDEIEADLRYIRLLRDGSPMRVVRTDLTVLLRTVRLMLKMTGE